MIYKKDIYVVKEHDAEGSVNSVKNGGFIATDTYSVYPNGFFRCSNDGRYTKHIYIGAERIVSQVGGKPYPSPNTESVSVAGRSNGIDIRVDYSGKLDQHLAQIDSVYDAFDLPYNGTNHDSYYNNYFFDRPGYWDNTEGLTLNGGEPEMPRSILDRDLLYCYHRDHLGSSTAVSNDDGKLSQQIEYLPYGEVFLEKQMASSDYHSPYKFNGKELDEETGLYYYGARYMNPRLSIWYGTDKLQEKCPHTSSYSICLSNPVRYWDITGMAPEDNPESSSPLEDYAKAVVNGIYYCSSFYDENNNGERDAKQVIYGYYNDLLQGQVTDTDISSADKYNMYVTMDRIFHVYESDANEYNNYEAHMVALLMTGFVTGTGPENYDFPENGIISSKFLNSAILKSALEDYNNGIKVNNKQYSFGLNVISNIIENQTPYNIVGLAGSAKITIEPEQNNMLKVTIFNITSLTSGAYGKEIGPKDILYPKSYMRVSGQRTPYGNISQTYHLLIENKR